MTTPPLDFTGLEIPPPSCPHGPLQPVRRDDGIIERWEPCAACAAAERTRVAARQLLDGMERVTNAGTRGVKA